MPRYRRASANWHNPVVLASLTALALLSAGAAQTADDPPYTLAREGFLYVGGTYNNRIGKWRIPGANEKWGAVESYWGAKR